MEFIDVGMCFACGQKNPIGLKLEFTEEGDYYQTQFTPVAAHQGYNDILHGGIMSTLMDEIMGRYLYIKEIIALTVELNVRFKKAVKIGQKLIVEGRISKDRGRLIEMIGVARLENGTVVAEATGKFIRHSAEL